MAHDRVDLAIEPEGGKTEDEDTEGHERSVRPPDEPGGVQPEGAVGGKGGHTQDDAPEAPGPDDNMKGWSDRNLKLAIVLVAW